MWSVLEPRVESVRRDLAREFGCDPEELAITRNASEAMEILILGHRPEARRRGDRHRPELPPDAHHLGSARPPRGRGGQERLLQGAAPLDRAFRRPDPPARSRPRPASSSSPTSSTSPGRSCRCARSWSWPVRWGSRCSSTERHSFAHFPFTRDELGCDYFATQPAQVAAGPDRHRLPLRPQVEDQVRSGR